MKRNDIEVRLAALGAAASLSALVLGAVVVAFGAAQAPRALPDALPPIARAADAHAPIPVAIVPGRIEVVGERSTETAGNESAAPLPRT